MVRNTRRGVCAERRGRRLRVGDLGPVVACAAASRAARKSATSGTPALRAASAALRGHLRGEGMRGVDHGVDAVSRRDSRARPVDAAEAADARGQRRRRRGSRCGRRATGSRRMPGSVGESRASAAASLVPPRMRTRMRRVSLNAGAASRDARPWLSLVGIGEDGLDGLSPAARAGRRASANSSSAARGTSRWSRPVRAERWPGPRPSTDAFPAILARRGRPVCRAGDRRSVLLRRRRGRSRRMSRRGDRLPVRPLGLPPRRVPARLGRQDCAGSACTAGRWSGILPHLQPGARILALSWDGTTPARLRRSWPTRGMGRPRSPCWSAGRPARDGSARRRADGFGDRRRRSAQHRRDRGRGRRPTRASSRSRRACPTTGSSMTARSPSARSAPSRCRRCAPQRGELLWDVGAGSGSIGIEWMLRRSVLPRHRHRAAAGPRGADPAQCAALGVPDLEIVEGAAPDALAGLPPPTPSSSAAAPATAGVLEAAWDSAEAGRPARRQRRDARDAGAARRRPWGAWRRAHRDRRRPRRAGRPLPRLAPGDAGRAMGVGEAAGRAPRDPAGASPSASAAGAASIRPPSSRRIDEALARPRRRGCAASTPSSTGRASRASSPRPRASACRSRDSLRRDCAEAIGRARDALGARRWRAVGVPSVAETAALAGAGPGSRARRRARASAPASRSPSRTARGGGA